MQFTRVNNKSGCAGPLVGIRIPRAQIVSNLGCCAKACGAWLPGFASNRSGLHVGTGANSVKLVDVPCTHRSEIVAIYYKGHSAT